jgi:hypothetical protein
MHISIEFAQAYVSVTVAVGRLARQPFHQVLREHAGLVDSSGIIRQFATTAAGEDESPVTCESSGIVASLERSAVTAVQDNDRCGRS